LAHAHCMRSPGVGTICAAFYPKRVILRFSDFKTNEYAGTRQHDRNISLMGALSGACLPHD
jgi:phosphoenolpyruvate synthase/pyruvate phosphate dikinase